MITAFISVTGIWSGIDFNDFGSYLSIQKYMYNIYILYYTPVVLICPLDSFS